MSTEKQLEKEIIKIKKNLLELDLIHPGSVSEQYNICGTAGCQCKDERNPIKHGPYSNLSFSFKGKSKTKFIRKELVQDFQKYTSNYKKFRDYTSRLIECNIELIKLRSEAKWVMPIT